MLRRGTKRKKVSEEEEEEDGYRTNLSNFQIAAKASLLYKDKKAKGIPGQGGGG